MSANRSEEHLLVLPEDDANKDVFYAFLLQADSERQRQVDLLRYGRDKSGLGWTHVMEKFKKECLHRMRRHSTCYVLRLIDFDNWGDERRKAALELAGIEKFPELRNRLFILGSSSEAEDLRNVKGLKLDDIGKQLAEECREDREGLWAHDLLKHNREESNACAPSFGGFCSSRTGPRQPRYRQAGPHRAKRLGDRARPLAVLDRS